MRLLVISLRGKKADFGTSYGCSASKGLAAGAFAVPFRLLSQK